MIYHFLQKWNGGNSGFQVECSLTETGVPFLNEGVLFLEEIQKGDQMKTEKL